MHRFFAPATVRSESSVALPGDLAHQIGRVLRLRPDEEIVVIPTGGPDAVEWRVRLTAVEPRAVRGMVVAERPGLPEATCAVTLCAAVLKGERFDWLVQKATELGAAAIVPLLTARTVRKVGAEDSRALERWRRIATEAAEQSGRSVIPAIAPPTPIAGLAGSAPKPLLVAHEREAGTDLRAAIPPGADALSLVIGPEGGLTEAEVAECGGVPVSLGPRILRAETAAITAVTLAMAATGNLAPAPDREWRALDYPGVS